MPEDTHNLSFDNARTVLEGAVCANCEYFPMKTLHSRLALFLREGAAPGGSGPARAKAEQQLHSWGSKMKLAAEFERGVTVSQPPAAGGDELLDGNDVLSLTSSDPGASVLLAVSPREQEMAVEEEAKIEKAWKSPYSARIHPHQRGNFDDVEGLRQHRYVSMPPVDETFVNYLVTGRALTLKAPVYGVNIMPHRYAKK
ncbi:hypothetical protein DPX16_7010 [Anabarilius grahami]|uniref:Uncharacterized protein n=1 Tax=Anabarilius grahami TaxID=495550 RepID=A0A3N0Z4J8_ANAGA|nr:hypothetical protein DPX16_7010 [Anabarilius grahami]